MTNAVPNLDAERSVGTLEAVAALVGVMAWHRRSSSRHCLYSRGPGAGDLEGKQLAEQATVLNP